MYILTPSTPVRQDNIPRYPNLPEFFKKYVSMQLIRIRDYLRQVPLDDNKAKMYRSIRSGGSSSFTNKINDEGVIDLSEQETNDLITRVYDYYALANLINGPILPKQEEFVHVYRSVKKGIDLDSINQPIPFSCSWDVNFPLYKWGGNKGTHDVLEIKIKTNTNFLSTSYPGNLSDLPDDINISNQEQLEVMLPPCRLTKIGEYETTLSDGKNVVIHSYDINIYTDDQFEQEIIEMTPDDEDEDIEWDD